LHFKHLKTTQERDDNLNISIPLGRTLKLCQSCVFLTVAKISVTEFSLIFSFLFLKLCF